MPECDDPASIDCVGDEDGFFSALQGMSRFGQCCQLWAEVQKFQPVYVDDVAAAAVMGVQGRATGVFEQWAGRTMRE
jgi:NADH dehydrogenase